MALTEVQTQTQSRTQPGTQPLISVIVPVFDVADFVGPCLASLKAQSWTAFEAIVIDDGSRDDSRDRVVAAIAGDARFRLLSVPNAGLSAARNLGLDLARGDWIAFLDGDDAWEPEFLTRMAGALQETGADWAACGLRYVPAGGGAEGVVHSAIHSDPRRSDPQPRMIDLTDWRDVVDHFPSAWNKLYRAEALLGLRFDPGLLYEDHAFFWQVALRCPRLVHLAEPLVRQTVGRAGQITGDGGERVFDQFAVLDRLEGLIPDPAERPGGAEAFARLALRLMSERAAVIRDPARLARFVTRAEAFLAARGLDWRALRGPGPLDHFARALAGRRSLSVILPSDGAAAPLLDSLRSLATQRFRDFQVLLVSDGTAGALLLAEAAEGAGMGDRVSILGADPRWPAAAETMAQRVARARNRGLAAAEADFVLFLDAGDVLQDWALDHWLAAMTGGEDLPEHGADLGFSAFLHGTATGARHGGVHDEAPFAGWSGPDLTPEAAVALHAVPSAKLFRRAFLQQAGLQFAPHDWQGWEMTLRAALAARQVRRLPGEGLILGEAPEARRFWRAAPDAAALLSAWAGLAGHLPPDAAPGLAGRLLTRAIWEKVLFGQFADAAGRFAFDLAVRAAWGRMAADLPLGTEAASLFDPYMQPGFRRYLEGGQDRP